MYIQGLRFTFIFTLLFVTLIGSVFHAEAQTNLNKKLYPGMNRRLINSRTPMSHQIIYKWTYFAGTGFATYFGDLCPTGNCWNKTNYEVNVGVRYRFNPRMSVGASLRNFRVGGDDAKNGVDNNGANGRQRRNLSFTSNCWDFIVFGTYDFLPIINKFSGSLVNQYARRRPFVPYGTIGIGFLYFAPKAELNGKTYNLKNMKTEDNKSYSGFTPLVNYGIGVKYKVGDFVDVAFDLSYNITFSDYLDDVSNRYPKENLDPGFATSIDGQLADRGPTIGISRRDPNAKVGRGDPKDKDGYILANFRVDYTVFNLGKVKNPKLNRRR